MPNRNPETEALARQIVKALCILGEGRSHVDIELSGTEAEAVAALQLAAANGWVLIGEDHRISLTVKGLEEVRKPGTPPAYFKYPMLAQHELTDDHYCKCPICGHMIDELDREEVMRHLEPNHQAPLKN